MSAINVPGAVPPGTDLHGGTVLFVGTATVLLRLGGFTILTDPNFLHQGDHVHLGYGLVAKRLTEPALDIDQVPPLDLVVLSHYHGDHFDRVAEQRLDRSLPIVTTPHAAAKLRRVGFRAPRALSPWQAVEVAKPGALPLRITAMPGQHGPSAVSWLLPPVMGSLLEFGRERPFRLYISGDTVVHDDLRQIPRRVAGIHLALLHLGGTRILGIYVTMDAAQGVEALRILDPERAIPIHYNDYSVFKSPLEDFRVAVRAAGLEDRVHYLRHGETLEFRIAAEGRRDRAS